jgi:hypothetical protein
LAIIRSRFSWLSISSLPGVLAVGEEAEKRKRGGLTGLGLLVDTRAVYTPHFCSLVLVKERAKRITGCGVGDNGSGGDGDDDDDGEGDGKREGRGRGRINQTG